MSRTTPCGTRTGLWPAIPFGRNDGRAGWACLCGEKDIAPERICDPRTPALETYAKVAQQVPGICEVSGKTSRFTRGRQVRATVSSALLQAFVTTAGTIGRS